MLPSCNSFLNSIEQIKRIAVFNNSVKRQPWRPHVQKELRDAQNLRLAAGLNQQQWRATVFLDLAAMRFQKSHNKNVPIGMQQRNHAGLNIKFE